MSQPETAPAPIAWDDDRARALVRERKHLAGALLPVLHAVQDTFGYVPREATALVAEELNLSRAEVHGVLSFYHYFRQSPPAKHRVWICRAEACQSMNSDTLAERAAKKLNDDGLASLEPVYCLGQCACAPAIMIDGRVHGRVDAERLDALLDEFKE